MSGEMFEREFRELHEMVEQAYQAVSTIGPSEIRLMSKPVREGLAAFMKIAEKVVAELTLARHRDNAVEVYDRMADAVAKALNDDTPDEPEDNPNQEALEEMESGYIDDLSHEGSDEGPVIRDDVGPWNRDDPEIMCPQTKHGVRCNRPLHNVGLHTPDGYPENGTSWTDKESDD